MKEADVMREIEEIVSAQLEQHSAVAADWIAQAVMNNHPDISGADEDFHRLGSSRYTRGLVRKFIQRFKPNADQSDSQYVLEGFDRMTLAYLLDRDNTQMIVSVDRMTDDELYSKAGEYRVIGDGCYAHADEIERYILERNRIADVG